MQFVRMVAPWESCWVLHRRTDHRIVLVALLASLGWAATNPKTIAYGYMPMRNLTTIAMMAVCAITMGAQAVRPLIPRDPVRMANLALQTAWMGLHTVFSLTAPWYTETWHKRQMARWTYVLSAMVICVLYQKFFTSLRVPSADRSKRRRT